jgi:two-component system nitrogen regulation sensor histidine kinase GlnL
MAGRVQDHLGMNDADCEFKDLWWRELQTAVLALDAELRVKAINAAAEELLGVDGAAAAGRSGLIELEALAALLQRCRSQGQALVSQDIAWSRDGRTLLFDMAVSPLPDGGVLLELHDAELRRTAFDDRARSARQALSRRVVQQLAHEIRNPLAGLRGAAQLLARDEPDPARRELGEIICSEADRLARLVGRLLGPSGPWQPAAANIHGPVDRAWRVLRSEAGEGQCLERDYDPSLPELTIDAEPLQQAVLNLGRNALQAGAASVCLATRAVRYRTWNGVLHRQAVAIEIVDDGPGVPPSLVDSLFFPLVTSKAEGSGLGLAIAQDIVDRHGGRIEFESRPGHTVFRILLPLPDRTRDYVPENGPNPGQSQP